MRKVPKRVIPTEAPEGYFAVLKPSVRNNPQNLCLQCDWRKQCNDPKTNRALPQHRCMIGTVVYPDGKEVTRKDGCSVLFKKRMNEKYSYD